MNGRYSAVSMKSGQSQLRRFLLDVNGLIDMNELKTSAFLTPEVYDAVERVKGLGVRPGGCLTI